MDTLSLVTGSALASRTLVQAIKNRGYLKNGVAIVVTTGIINFIFALIYGVYSGQPLTVSFAKSVLSTVAAALYHDLNTGMQNS